MADFDKSTAFEEADGILDYVKLMFLTDLGDGHMESFDQGEQFDFDSEFQLVSHTDATPNIHELLSFDLNSTPKYYQSNYLDDVPILRRYLLSHIDFRGPPVQA